MNYPIRYAIWAAVSTEQQAAADKFSLSDQENLCRERALSRGWIETHPPFIVRGQSRTRWVNLRDAETAIPALRELLDAAKEGDFDLLILYDYTRLRDLLDPVAKVLADYHVQVYSLNQPTEPIPPEQFAIYGSETEETMRYAHGFASRAEINSIRKRYRDNMPARVTTKGLHSVGPLPFGYCKPFGRELDPNAIPILDPPRALIVTQIKDRFLSGQSLPQIVDWLNTANISTIRGRPWQAQTLRQILTNPYYSGTVHFRSIRRLRDRRTGRIRDIRNTDPEQIITAPGKHPSLWDEATHLRILAEFKQRGHAFRGRTASQLSRLLECECGARLWAYYDGSRIDPTYRRWRCSNHSKGHTSIRERDLLPRIAIAFADQLHHLDNLQLPTVRLGTPDPALLEQTQRNLQARLTRWQDAYEQGLPYTEYTARAEPIKTQLRDIQHQLTAHDEAHQQHQIKLDQLTQLAQLIDSIPDYIQHAPPQEVNARLRTVIQKITVNNNGDFEFSFW